METTEDFSQLRLRFIDPVQHDYELVRPVVLFAQPIAARSRETDTERSTVGDKARRFVTEGMSGLVDQRKGRSGRKGHQYPEPVANYILYLKQLYPPIAYREIARIVGRKFGYKTNHHTVKNFLARNPIPIQLEFALETFHEFEDAYQARWTVVRMYYEGWQRNQQASEFFAVDIILHNLAANRVDLLPNHLRGDPCGACDNHFGARSRPRFLATFRPLLSPEDRAAGTRSAHDGARSRHAGTPRPDQRSRLGRGPVASSVLSSPLSSRAR